MKETFTYLLLREIYNEDDSKVIDTEPAVCHPYSSYTFDDMFIYASGKQHTDVYLKSPDLNQKGSEITVFPVLPLDKFNYITRDGNFFIVRIGSLWGAYTIDGEKIIQVMENSNFSVKKQLENIAKKE